MNRNLLVLGGAALIVVGSFLPWASAGGMSFSGIDGGDGWITLVLGLALGATALIPAAKNGMLIVAGIALALVVYELIDIMGAGGGAIEVSIGIGIWIMLVGGIAGLVGAIQARKGEEAAPAATV